MLPTYEGNGCRPCSPSFPNLSEGRCRRSESRSFLNQASREPHIASNRRNGLLSGNSIDATGTKKVCSNAYWPDTTACGTASVKAIQVEPGGNSMSSVRQ